MDSLSISEVFYSIQGEGKTMGIPSVFVRLGGCNLLCGGMGTQFDKKLHNGAEWRCDTIEVWMVANSIEVDKILDDECEYAIENNAHLILTGGEPLIQQKNVVSFIKYVKENINENVFVEIETNGTIEPNEEMKQLVNLFNCSPKLANSGNDYSMRFNINVIKALNKLNTIFKFVINTKKEIEEIKKDYFNIIDRGKIWLMPAGENIDLLNENKKVVVELAKQYCFNFSSRLHIEIWNKKTGV